MAGEHVRALMAAVRVIIGLIAGYGVWWVWTEYRGQMDPWYVPVGAGIIVVIFMFFLLYKLKSAGD